MSGPEETGAGLDEIKFKDNPEPRCAVALLVDTSSSMQGDAIAQLNEGMEALEIGLKKDKLASLRVELAVIPFGGGARVLDAQGNEDHNPPWDASTAFIAVRDFRAPQLRAGGGTPMGQAALQALQLLRDATRNYKRSGIDFYRPWLVLITDGQPTDDGWESAARQVQAEEQRNRVAVYGIGVDTADMEQLGRFCAARPPMKLRGLAFSEFFEWLSISLSSVSQSRIGEQVALTPTAGWAATDTTYG